MFNASNNNQQTPTSMPEQSQPKFQYTPRKKHFALPKIPLVAQISGLLSLLVIGAGLLTVNQLASTPQDLQSQAATGTVLLEFDQQNATLEYGQEKTFYIIGTPSSSTMKISAALIRVRNEHLDLVTVTNMSPIANVLPVVLKPFAEEMNSASIVQHAITLGAEPTKPVIGRKTLVEVKVRAKEKAGRAPLEIALNSEIAAFDNAGNVNKQYDLEDANKQYLLIEVKAPSTGAVNKCIGKTAAKVNGDQRTPLAANAKVRKGEEIEYTVTVSHAPGTQAATIIDTLPPQLEYISGTAKVNGQAVDAFYTASDNKLTYAINIPANHTGNYTYTYQTRVKANATIGNFTNAVTVAFNGDHQNADRSCKITLAVEEGTPPPPAAKLNVGFRMQGVNKAGVTVPATITVRYKKKNTNEIVKKVYTANYTSSAPTSADVGPAGIFLPPQGGIDMTDFNINEVDAVPGSQSPTPGVEIYVKTPTTLRKKLGVIRINSNPPVVLTGIFKDNPQVLMVGDFDRSPEQENKFRITDINRMMNHYVQVNNPVNNQNKEFDVNHDGTFNPLDIALIMDNYKKILTEGDNP